MHYFLAPFCGELIEAPNIKRGNIYLWRLFAQHLGD